MIEIQKFPQNPQIGTLATPKSLLLPLHLLFPELKTSSLANRRRQSKPFKVFYALTMAAMGISQSCSFAVDFSKAKNAAASIFAIIDRKSKIDSSDESGVKLDIVKGEIELHHVIFKYPSRQDIQIFRDLSLTIHCGNTVALVGESGSGKSSVVALLQRFYDPDSGHITLDGIELGKFQLKWLRQQMGLVSQEPALFNDTIRANIAYGKEGDATEAEIIAASELANAYRFISSLGQVKVTKVFPKASLSFRSIFWGLIFELRLNGQFHPFCYLRQPRPVVAAGTKSPYINRQLH
ncbi:hypothetical protein PRUPE_3G123600 [Prunus persica]|uniref:ABC transporter domain-containing protein n=1 Tax=Prunus persica TaxID=3760 RepID=A0A251PZ00_PRUPE|nr:hypothetical protein PRUPE_3G123600 [Prunus persica]